MEKLLVLTLIGGVECSIDALLIMDVGERCEGD